MEWVRQERVWASGWLSVVNTYSVSTQLCQTTTGKVQCQVSKCTTAVCMLRLGQECTELICCIQTSWIISSVQVQSSSKSVYRQRVYAMSGNLQRGVSYHVECPASVCLHTSPWHFAYLQHWLWTESTYLSLYAQILMKTIEGRWKPGSAKESNKRHGSWVGLVALRVTVFWIRYGQKQVCVCVCVENSWENKFVWLFRISFVRRWTNTHTPTSCLLVSQFRKL